MMADKPAEEEGEIVLRLSYATPLLVDHIEIYASEMR
jgi:hypothetical protein